MVRGIATLVALIVLVILWPIAVVESKTNVPHVDVLIGQSLKSIVVSGIDLKRDLLLQGKAKQHQGHNSVKFKCDFAEKMKQAELLKSTKISPLLAQVSSPTGIITWNEGKYQGEFYMTASEKWEGCHLIHRISLENYLSTLLAKEMNPQWPLEALKAQAVAARSYALYKIQERRRPHKRGKKHAYDLENSERDQVNGNLLDETASTSKATRMTRGEVLLTSSGKLNPIFFHSKCGGKTLLPSQVWDQKIPEYESVECPFCKDHGEESWSYNLTSVEIRQILEKRGQNRHTYSLSAHKEDLLKEGSLQIFPDRPENVKLRLDVLGNLEFLNKIYIRRFLGREKIKSNYFYLSKNGDQVQVKGQGNGHGVGMCQFGALEMADKGWSYKEILKYYFPQFKLSKVY